MTNEVFRQPTELERALVLKLASQDFTGANEVREQLRGYLVKTIDEEGSFQIQATSAALAVPRNRVPVELCGADSDGVTVHVLLHVVDGIVREVEIYKDDSSLVCTFPETWSVFTP